MKRFYCIGLVMLGFLVLSVTTTRANQDEIDLTLFIENHGTIMLMIEGETGNILYANKVALDFYGYTQEEMKSMNINQINTLSSEEIAHEMALAMQEQRNVFNFKHRLANGEIRDIQTHAFPFVFEGRPVLFSVITDVTPMMLLNEQLSQRNGQIIGISFGVIAILVGFLIFYRTINSKLTQAFLTIKASETKQRTLFSQLQSVLISVGDGIITVNAKGKVEFLNPIAEKLTGYSLSEIYNRDFEEVFRLFDERTQKPMDNPVSRVLENQKITGIGEHALLKQKEGYFIAIEDTASPIFDDQGQCIGVVIVFKDATERRQRVRDIEILSFNDYLTGLYNRRYFEEQLRRLDNDRRFPLAIIIADVDGLKTFNDGFGHKVGDSLLIEVAQVIKENCRFDEIIARTGGDEFSILLPNCPQKECEALIERLNTALHSRQIMGVNISVSFGFAVKTMASESMNQVLQLAEDRMYRRKMLERKNSKFFSIQSMLDSLLQKNSLEKQHSTRVGAMCYVFAKRMGFSELESIQFKIAGELHDVGKIAISDEILGKTSSLTEEEWVIIRKHPETGFRIISTISEYKEIAEIVYGHHEHVDGKGYPQGLLGEQISQKARMLSIIDSYDAMISDRPYRKALLHHQAMEVLHQGAGNQFDERLLRRFIKYEVYNTTIESTQDETL